jgi:homoserine dehydrogenase
MPHYKLAFLGFGNVGQALGRLLLRKQEEIGTLYKITFSTTGITTGRHGSAIDRNGIDLKQALIRMEKGESLDSLSAQPHPSDSLDFIRNCAADVLFENTPVNYQTGQPAVDHLQNALSMGMYAITANKGPVVHAYGPLTELANSKGLKFYFESTVMDGAPLFSLFRGGLPAANLNFLRGILNSTTNLILNRMEDGESFEEAVAYAQRVGIAETDPSGDVDGWDAAIKVSALVTVLMGIPLKPDEVDRQGIRNISPSDITRAKNEGKRWKLVCTAKRDGKKIIARVAPEMVSSDSPLYNVNGTTSIVQLDSDVLGQLSVIESDPGPHTTAYGLLADFLNAVRD